MSEVSGDGVSATVTDDSPSYPSLTVSASFKESSGGGKSSSRRRPVRPSFDAAADNEFITLLHGSDPVKVELNRLENDVRDKDRELGEAHAEIKALRLSERQREKAVEELTEELAKLDEKLKLTESILQSKPTNMSGEFCPVRPLFGGAISTHFPQRFQDVSNVRQVPDHQEVFVDPSRNESLIFELLDFKIEVGDNGSATWFLHDLAREQDAEGFKMIEQSEIIEAPGLSFRNIPAAATTAIGEMAISKGKQGREAQNLVRVYVANLRLKGVDTDVLVTAYEPIHINPLSESAVAVGSGLAVPASQSGIMAMSDVIKQSLSTFKVNDWSLFGSSA